jgi:hypothetical protein
MEWATPEEIEQMIWTIEVGRRWKVLKVETEIHDEHYNRCEIEYEFE